MQPKAKSDVAEDPSPDSLIMPLQAGPQSRPCVGALQVRQAR